MQWDPMAWEEQSQMTMTQNNPCQELWLITVAGLSALWRMRKSASGHENAEEREIKSGFQLTPLVPLPTVCTAQWGQ